MYKRVSTNLNCNVNNIDNIDNIDKYKLDKELTNVVDDVVDDVVD